MPRDEKTGDAEPLAWRRRKDFRPQEILAAARQLIEERGTRATSMANIAQAAGVSEATVYKYFDNKQELVNAVLIEWAAPFVERLTSELGHVTDLRSQLSLVAVRFLRSMEETPRFHRVVFQEVRWSDYRGSAIHALNREFAQTVVDAVERGKQSGEIGADIDPIIVRDMMFGGLEHMAIRTSLVGRPLDIDAEARRFVDTLLSGILAAPSTAAEQPDPERLAGLLDRMEAMLDRRDRG